MSMETIYEVVSEQTRGNGNLKQRERSLTKPCKSPMTADGLLY